MTEEQELYEQGLEEYPKAGIILNNLVVILWIALGAIACWFFHPVAGWVFLAVAIMTVYGVLRKLVCTDCYYYDRWCSMGWGKLCALLFREGEVERFSAGRGMRVGSLAYGLLGAIPPILAVISILRGFSMAKVAVLVLLLLTLAYMGVISKRKSCEECKVRFICPGSAAK
jgi:hypothetical protein